MLNWLAFEIVGGLVGFLISRSLPLASLLGFACGFGAYLLAKYRLDNISGAKKDEHWTDRLGKQDEDQ